MVKEQKNESQLNRLGKETDPHVTTDPAPSVLSVLPRDAALLWLGVLGRHATAQCGTVGCVGDPFARSNQLGATPGTRPHQRIVGLPPAVFNRSRGGCS